MKKAQPTGRQGFTIIELLVVILIISIGITGSYALVGNIFASSSLMAQRLSAAYLAQEGIEIVRNIRDSNWVNGDSWNNGITTGNFEVDYDDLALSAYSGNKLKINNNIYNHTSGTDSIYDRKITISLNGDGSLNVAVIITWFSNSSNHSILIEENIYDWK